MRILLRLKHWQIFLTLFLPFIFQADSVFGQILWGLFFVIYLAWIYMIGATAYTRLPRGHNVKLIYFNASFIFQIITLTITCFFHGGYTITQDNYQEFGSKLWYVIPFILLGLLSLLYVFYFAAKMLMSALEGKVVDFDKSLGYFFAFWFFPIGIWFIQPKANILDNDNSNFHINNQHT
jgi:hypothetical protein